MTLSRRHVLTHGAALTAAAVLPAEAQAQSVLLRPNVSSLAPNHPILVSYRTAINAMKALPQSDPRNWTRQAQIHQGNNTVRCPHGNWYFLPWHRAYLLAFERICRQLSGNANFALPYWDWTANPQLPAAFAAATFNGQPNALFDNTRSSQTVTIPTNIAGSTVMANIYAETTFEIFGSARPAGAEQHQPAMADRATERPDRSKAGRTTACMAASAATWAPTCRRSIRSSGCTIATSIASGTGGIAWAAPTPATRCGAISRSTTSSACRRATPARRTTSRSPVCSTSSNSAIATSIPIYLPSQLLVARRLIDLSKITQIAKVAAPAPARINAALDVNVRLNAPQVATLRKIRPLTPSTGAAKGLGAAPVAAPDRILAFIRDVEPPANGNAEVRVFVNHPDPKPDTSPQDRHYVGSFTFFGAMGDHAGHGGGQTFLFDLTETVRKLSITDSNVTDDIKVQLVPVPMPGVPATDLQFKVGSIEVATV